MGETAGVLTGVCFSMHLSTRGAPGNRVPVLFLGLELCWNRESV